MSKRKKRKVKYIKRDKPTSEESKWYAKFILSRPEVRTRMMKKKINTER